MKKSILVTGGAGFIGSNLIRALLKTNSYKIITIDNLDGYYHQDQKIYNLKPFLDNENFTFIKGDIRNITDLEKIAHIDIIIHLAAKVGVRSSIDDPILYYDVNIKGTQRLLEFAENRKVRQFLFASSSSIYGINPNLPWNEDEKSIQPISPYAYSKLLGEKLGELSSKSYGIRFLALRFFTVYGPGQRPDLVIHKFLKSMLNNQEITVYGDGSTSRDYTYVTDIVNGIINAIDYDKSNYEIINLGNNNPIKLTELINALEITCNRKANIHQISDQLGDVPITYADIIKANHYLGYKSTVSLMQGLKKYYKWYLNYKLSNDNE